MKKRVTEQQLLELSDQALTKLIDYYGRCREDADLQPYIRLAPLGEGKSGATVQHW